MVGDGTWQKMTDDGQEGITRRATQGHMGLENIGKLATEAKEKSCFIPPYQEASIARLRTLGGRGEKNYNGEVMWPRPDGVQLALVAVLI